MGRQFYWHQVQLCPSEFPTPTVVCLSTSDTLLPADIIQKQIRVHFEASQVHDCSDEAVKIDVMTYTAPHGGCMLDDDLQQKMLLRMQDRITEVYGEPKGDEQAVDFEKIK